MPESEWRSPASYVHARRIPVAGIAWEYLRRDDGYRQDFRRVRALRRSDDNVLAAFALRWGLRFPG
jgi:hypothetical protein